MHLGLSEEEKAINFLSIRGQYCFGDSHIIYQKVTKNPPPFLYFFSFSHFIKWACEMALEIPGMKL